MSIYDEPAPFVSPGVLRARRAVSAVLVGALAIVAVVASIVIVRGGAEALLGQCTPPWLAGTDPQVCLNAHISRRTLVVSGNTSLPDGAIVRVWADDPGLGPGADWTTDTVDCAVIDGSFGRSFDVTDWGAGTVTVTAIFEVGPKQPAEVVDRYGANGERISGPEVLFDLNASSPAARMVQVSTNVDLSAG